MPIDSRQPGDRRTRERILSIPGVVSISRGLDRGQEVVVIGVESMAVARSNDFPDTIDGLPVVFEEQEPPSRVQFDPPVVPPGAEPPGRSFIQGSPTGRHRPVPAGVSIGHRDVTAGTASFLATDGSTVYQLSNNHVLAMLDQAEVGDPVVQPGPHDGGTVEEDQVGELAGFVPITETGAVSVDVAWYEPSVNVTEEIFGSGLPTANVVDPQLGDTITWAGRTSGLKTATVDRVGMAGNVGPHAFEDLFRIDTPFQPGDSGSPMVVENDQGEIQPAGIAFASNQTNGVGCYASNVEAETGLSILPVGAPTNGGSGQIDINPRLWLAAAGVGLLFIVD